MSEEPVVTRFAPSPTGALHVGGARTALFNWAFARGRGGKFILRMEDTDRKRSSASSAQTILDDLKWLGLDWDDGPHYQSERLDIYNRHIEQLLESGRALVPQDDPDIVRFRMGQDVAFDDAVYGPIAVKAAELEDFVIRKSDGFPTFHLAVVVDDAAMGVTHVIRGQEHLTNTTKHAALYDALGVDRPVWAHTPSIMNPDGSKMSKRDKAKVARKALKQWLAEHDNEPEALGTMAALANIDVEALKSFQDKKSDDVETAEKLADPSVIPDVTLPEIDVIDFRHGGFLQEAFCNYIALLGWNPGNDIERFDMDFLVSRFDLDRMGKANSRFDRGKLAAFNGELIAKLPAQDWIQRLRSHLNEHHESFSELAANDGNFARFAEAYQARSRTLDEPAQLGEFLVVESQSITYDDKAVRKVLAKNDNQGFEVLEVLNSKLESCDWSAESLNALIKGHADEHSLGMGQVAQPLRVAVCGSTVSPPIDLTLVILGRDETLARIRRCMSLLSAQQ